MPAIRHTVCRTLPIILVLVGPFAVGALPPAIFWPFFAVSSVVAICAVKLRSVPARKAALVLASTALAITASDVALRFFSIVPDDLIERWPRMPLVYRYLPNLNYEGYRFNDLSRMAGVEEWREAKLVRIVTDPAGFRNAPTATPPPIDVILLGDSFGAGAVSQEETLSSLLAAGHNLNAYNLSSPASGPWQQYVNLLAEQERLETGPRATLIWQLFTGNDLDDYYGTLAVGDLPWSGPLGQWLNRINSARGRSPVRRLLRREDRSMDVVACDFLNGRKLLFYRPYIETSFRSREQIVGHPNFARFRETIHAVRALAGSRGMRLLIVLVPAKEEVYEWVWRGRPPWTDETGQTGFASALSDICAQEGIPLLDLKPHLAGAARRAYEQTGQLFYWYDDTHLSASGNRFVADVLYGALSESSAASP